MKQKRKKEKSTNIHNLSILSVLYKKKKTMKIENFISFDKYQRYIDLPLRNQNYSTMNSVSLLQFTLVHSFRFISLHFFDSGSRRKKKKKQIISFASPRWIKVMGALNYSDNTQHAVASVRTDISLKKENKKNSTTIFPIKALNQHAFIKYGIIMKIVQQTNLIIIRKEKRRKAILN